MDKNKIVEEKRDLQFRIKELEETLTELNKRYARTVNIDDFAYKVNSSRTGLTKFTDREKELLVLVKDNIRDIFWNKRIEKWLIEEVKELKKEDIIDLVKEFKDTTNHRIDGLRIDLDYYVKKLEENIQGLSDRVDDLELEDNE